MNDAAPSRDGVLAQAFPGLGIGLLVGLLVGLSVSPVVSGVLTTLGGLLGAMLGLQTDGGDGAARVHPLPHGEGICVAGQMGGGEANGR